MVIKIRDALARCDFLSIPLGTYALGVVHNENMNGKLDSKWLGIPKEGYGVEGVDVGNRLKVQLIRTDVEKGYIDFKNIQ